MFLALSGYVPVVFIFCLVFINPEYWKFMVPPALLLLVLAGVALWMADTSTNRELKGAPASDSTKRSTPQAESEAEDGGAEDGGAETGQADREGQDQRR